MPSSQEDKARRIQPCLSDSEGEGGDEGEAGMTESEDTEDTDEQLL